MEDGPADLLKGMVHSPLAVTMNAFKVLMAHVHDIVDGESYEHDDRDALRDTKSIALPVDYDHHISHDACDRQDGHR
jgi:hypothetical protein